MTPEQTQEALAVELAALRADAELAVEAMREKAGLLDLILREGYRAANADLCENEDGHFVRFTLRFDVPEPKDWPNYGDEEWTEEQLLAALRAAKGEK